MNNRNQRRASSPSTETTGADVDPTSGAADAAANEGEDTGEDAMSDAENAAAILSTPAGKALMQAAVEAATARIVAELEAKRSASDKARAEAMPDPENAPSDATSLAFARHLAAQIAELADQGNGKKSRVAPAVLEKRRLARERMEDLLVEAFSTGNTPQYGLKAAQYLDEVLVQPTYIDGNHRRMQTKIGWDKVPNEGMVPMNPVAADIFAAFMESIGGESPIAPKRSEAGSSLKVLHEGNGGREPAAVGAGRRRGGLEILGRGVEGEIVETNVLGTVANPARQMA